MSADALPTTDARIDRINDLVSELVAGNYTVRGTPSGDGHTLDQITYGFNQLADTLLKQQTAHHEAEQRGNELVDIMMRMASLDYTSRAPVRDEDGIFDALGAGLNMLIDELVAAQETQLRLQEEIIHVQAAAIQELSTPLIPLSDGVLVMPLIGTLDTRRAQQVLERLLTGIVENRTHTAILDITGVAIVDTQVANALMRAAQAVQLLGAEVVLTGIRPEVAQTLIDLGIDLRKIVTRSTLQTGIAYATMQGSMGVARS